MRDRLNYATTAYPHELVAITTSESVIRRALKQLNKELLGQIDSFAKSIMEVKTNEQHKQSTNTGVSKTNDDGRIPSSTQAAATKIPSSAQTNQTDSNDHRGQYGSQTAVGGTKTAQRAKGFKDLEIEQQENSKSVQTTKIFNTKDIKKAIDARQKNCTCQSIV